MVEYKMVGAGANASETEGRFNRAAVEGYKFIGWLPQLYRDMDLTAILERTVEISDDK